MKNTQGTNLTKNLKTTSPVEKKSRSPYKNSERTKQTIRKAVIKLLAKKKDLKAISISDIAKEADINRGTFYHHYRNVSDVINEIEDALMAEVTQSWEISSKQNDSLKSFLSLVFKTYKDNSNTYHQIVNYIPRYVYIEMKDKFIQEAAHHFEKDDSLSQLQLAEINLLASGMITLVIEYFEDKTTLTLDQIEEYSYQLIISVFPQFKQD
jgi:AcrR family transcriptional regulator